MTHAKRIVLGGALTACVTVFAGADHQHSRLREHGPIVRETRFVMIGSVREKWQLVWRNPPQPVCSPDPEDSVPDWMTCPCQGFAFGEYGQLDLIRVRPGTSDERFSLTPLYGETPAPDEPAAVLSRWPALPDDYKLSEAHPDEFGAAVRARNPTTIMHIADYDHDGRATEFPLQIEAFPCGHRATVLVGVSRRLPRLHAFGTVLHPNKPLILRDPSQWDALLHSQGNVSLLQKSCGDHGSDEEVELELHIDAQGIHARRLVYSCSPDLNSRGPLRSREEF
jgi:hypothetical protein